MTALEEMAVVKKFAGKAAVVTGSGRGIGRATAECFADEGAGVVLFGWHRDILEEVAQGIRDKGGACDVCVGDVSRRSDVAASVARCAEVFGRHDFMVANAGIADFVPFVDGSDAAWEQQIGIDLKGTWLCLQESARQMIRENHGGAQVVVSSTNAFQPEQGGVFYNLSKSGQVAVMHTAAMELAPYGIRVNGIAPGIVRTRLSPVTEDPVQSKVFLGRTPMNRFAEPEEIARPILFMCSDDASFMSGALLVIDGAYSVGLPVPMDLAEPLIPDAVR